MSDITIRLRTWYKAVDAVPAIDLMDEAANEIARLRGDAEVARLRLEAAQGEIERLRSQSLIRDSAAQIERLLAEIARLRLTDEEREAIEQAIDTANGMAQIESWALCTLRKLLDRLHT